MRAFPFQLLYTWHFSQAVIVSSTYHTGNSKETPTIDDEVNYNYKFNYITNRIVLINARNLGVQANDSNMGLSVWISPIHMSCQVFTFRNFT
jgi:hypothetical protein